MVVRNPGILGFAEGVELSEVGRRDGKGGERGQVELVIQPVVPFQKSFLSEEEDSMI